MKPSEYKIYISVESYEKAAENIEVATLPKIT